MGGQEHGMSHDTSYDRSMGMDRGTTYHDYDVETNLGMVSFLYRRLDAGKRGNIGISKEDSEGSWGSIGYVELLYNPGITGQKISIAAGLSNEKLLTTSR